VVLLRGSVMEVWLPSSYGAAQGVTDYYLGAPCPTAGGYAEAAGTGFLEGGVPWDQLMKIFGVPEP
jgi:hypothetical protein